MLKKSAQILTRVLCTMPDYLNDYYAFWGTDSEKKMSSEDLHQYLYMLEYCPQIINLIKSYAAHHPDNDLVTRDSLKLTWNYLVSKSAVLHVLSTLTQPIALHMEDCTRLWPDGVAEVLAAFQFKSLRLSNSEWELFHDSIPALSTSSASTLVSLEALGQIDLMASDVAKFSNLTHLDVSFFPEKNIADSSKTWYHGQKL